MLVKIIKSSIYSILVLLALLQVAEAREQRKFQDTRESLSSRSENLLMSALDNISQSRIDEALIELEILKIINPNFALAQLVYADLMTAKNHRITDFGNSHGKDNKQINALRDEILARWNYYKSPVDKTLIPSSLIQLSDKQNYVLVVDQFRHRMFLYKNRNGLPVYVDDFYVTIGKKGAGKIFEGDQKTPLGVYFVTRFIESSVLPDLYGYGAFPLNYPNIWDRRNGRTGTGIWLHGTPSEIFSRPPEDSDGCVIISNDDIKSLAPYIDVDQITPVILAKEIKWETKAEWKKRQKSFFSYLEQWRVDWESRDVELYLSHYSKDYEGLGKNYDSWGKHKRRVNKSKSFIKVNLVDTSIFVYPDGTGHIMVVTFLQNYNSNSFKRAYRKRQYWKMEEDGIWRIIFEGSV
jgi:murein L,D-transpeptidase YafK